MDLFNPNSSSMKPKSNSTFRIDAVNLSPLLQIEIGGSSKGTATLTKRMYQFVKGYGRPIAVPVFSSNGMRGLLRRIILEQLAYIGKDNGHKPNYSARSINLSASGDSNTVDAINKLTYYEVEKLRELSPLLSCFGAGLSGIEGKTAVTELRPDLECIMRMDGDKLVPNILIQEMTSVRFDQTKRKDTIFALIDEDDVQKWMDSVSENSADFKEKKALTAALKKAKEGKTRLSDEEEARMVELDDVKSIQSQIISSKEYVVPNVLFHGSISAKRGFQLTQVEEGMLAYALYELVHRQIGSSKKDGFGVLEWTISHDTLGDIVGKVNPNYIVGKRDVQVSPKMQEAIEYYKTWAKENRTWEYLETERLLDAVNKMLK